MLVLSAQLLNFSAHCFDFRVTVAIRVINPIAPA